jgi:hypothetical protein
MRYTGTREKAGRAPKPSFYYVVFDIQSSPTPRMFLFLDRMSIPEDINSLTVMQHP